MPDPLDNITLIIPVHQRQSTLKRILTYYNGFKCRKIVADSSDRPWTDIKQFPEYEYRFSPNELYYLKQFQVLSDVKTKFVVDVSDDDFTLKESIIQCIEFLVDNTDYSFAFGEVVRFSEEGTIQNIGFHGHFLKKQFQQHMTRNFYSKNAMVRIENYFKNFMSPNHFVIRTSAALHNFKTLLTYPVLYPAAFGDALYAFHALYHGNYKALPLVYQLRSVQTSLYLTESADYPKALEIQTKFEELISRLISINDPLSRMLADKTGLDKKAASEKLYEAFNNYHTNKSNYHYSGDMKKLPSYQFSRSEEWRKIKGLIRRYSLKKKKYWGLLDIFNSFSDWV